MVEIGGQVQGSSAGAIFGLDIGAAIQQKPDDGQVIGDDGVV